MSKPTIVLIHGAFADSSIWRPVYDHLAREGDTVLAPQNPLRGLPYDVSYTESLIDQIDDIESRGTVMAVVDLTFEVGRYELAYRFASP